MFLRTVTLISLLFASNVHAFDWQDLGEVEALNDIAPSVRSTTKTLGIISRQLNLTNTNPDAGVMNHQYGQARSTIDGLKQRNVKFNDVPYLLQDIQYIFRR